ncbi:MAG: hypothetical protein GF344_00210 [Chitinivibrionales bacterium]|nr:hypothetical protein [Chitinivibrionales bacterium]MBD3355554.1 hypothetical protein [Chitinivibrionales bacterium]
MEGLPRFYQDEESFAFIHQRLQLIPCPRCGLVSALILNGLVWGYCQNGSTRRKKGHRILCNCRRVRSPGCGGSFAVLLCESLPRLSIDTASLWKILGGVARGSSIGRSFDHAGIACSVRTQYRTLRRFRNQQANIRGQLQYYFGLPPPLSGADPIAQTIAHLQHAFPGSANPIAAFHLHAQTAFL